MNLFLIGLAVGTVLGAASCLLWQLSGNRGEPDEIEDWSETTYQRPAPIVREIAVTRLTNRRRTVELLSLITIINRLEEERSLNQTLLAKLVAGLDDDIMQIEQKKRYLEQEFADREAALTQIIEEKPAVVRHASAMVEVR